MSAADGLRARLDALDTVVALGEGRLDDALLREAEAARQRARERLGAGDEVTVAALAGPTGSGKSSLLNALAGQELSPSGLERPTTDAAHAWVLAPRAEVEPLLGWLGITFAHHDGDGEGLVVVDLPDVDSVEEGHRAVTEHFVERVDLLVWVLDPLKYSQRVIHEGFLRRLGEHAEVVIVALNRADELPPDDLAACERDVRDLLVDAGLEDARVVLTSATTGRGVDELRRMLLDEAGSRQAVVERIAADLRQLGARVEEAVEEVELPDRGALVDALSDVVGTGRIVDEAALAYRRQATPATGSASVQLWTAVTRRLSRLADAAATVAPGGQRQRSEPAARSAVSPSEVRAALIGLLPPATLRATAGGDHAEALAAALSRDVDAVPLRPEPRWWWTPLSLLGTLAELAMLLALGWLVLYGAAEWLALPQPPLPMATERLHWPGAVLLGGLAVRFALGVIRGVVLRLGARKHRRGARRRANEAVASAARRALLDPLRSEAAARRDLRDAASVLVR